MYFSVMEKEQSARQQKISRVLQQEIASLLQEALRMGAVKNLLVSVTKVRVTSDLSIAKVYLSIFPAQEAKSCIKALSSNSHQLRYDLSQRMRNQLRKIPELNFYLDDSLEYIDQIDRELKQGTNPFSNPESLESRQKK